MTKPACTTDPGRAAAWIAVSHNLSVGCRASDVVGVDLDRHGRVDGVARFEALCDQFGQQWPATFSVTTPNGGRHLYFAAAGQPIANSSGPGARLGIGIDVRGLADAAVAICLLQGRASTPVHTESTTTCRSRHFSVG
ncbi:bifunctional DNA primase/polymerase [Kribbella sp. CCNWLY201]|uniref:bifunctional DNA primase/polymerase n=1 Tax=unclassified Kribbella TaxID=2644121 RepID=UPI003FA536C2